jgi:hypothetical protein
MDGHQTGWDRPVHYIVYRRNYAPGIQGRFKIRSQQIKWMAHRLFSGRLEAVNERTNAVYY